MNAYMSIHVTFKGKALKGLEIANFFLKNRHVWIFVWEEDLSEDKMEFLDVYYNKLYWFDIATVFDDTVSRQTWERTWFFCHVSEFK